MKAAGEHQAVADFYTDGFNHPDRVWEVLSEAEETERVLNRLVQSPPTPAGSHTGGPLRT